VTKSLLPMAADAPTERALVAETLVSAPPAEVYRLWTSEAGIAAWWVQQSHIELRVLGPYELHLMGEQPEGSRGSEGCRVLGWLPDKMLAFTWNAPPNFGPLRDQYTQVVVEFDAVGDRTHVRLTHHGWPEPFDGRWPELYDYFETAWSRVLEALELHLAR
jgi:uncharacterized protein YndB with AHSA1/START domain